MKRSKKKSSFVVCSISTLDNRYINPSTTILKIVPYFSFKFKPTIAKEPVYHITFLLLSLLSIKKN